MAGYQERAKKLVDKLQITAEKGSRGRGLRLERAARLGNLPTNDEFHDRFREFPNTLR